MPLLTTPTREKDVEKKFVRMCKFKSVKLDVNGNRGIPDRMVLIPGGRAAFIEFKKPGELPTPLQQWWLEFLRKLGFHATWFTDAAQANGWVEAIAK